MIQIDKRSRDELPRWLDVLTPAVIAVAALALTAPLLLVFDVSPVQAYYVMIVGTVTSPSGFSNVVERFVPLFLAALSVYIPYRAGLWNLGTEGQIYIGAAVATGIAIFVEGSIFFILPLTIVVAGTTGAVWGAIPGYLRAKWGTNEILTSLMMTFIAIQGARWAIRGVLRAEANVLASEVIPPSTRLPEIPLIAVHVGILLAVLIAVIMYYVLNSTKFGVEVGLVGSNPEAAKHAGIGISRIYVLTMFIGGIIGAVAGMIEIFGVEYRLRPGFSPNYGFTAFLIAIIGERSTLHIAGASFLFALLQIGGNSLTVEFGIPTAITTVIIALIVIFILSAQFFKKYSISVQNSADEVI